MRFRQPLVTTATLGLLVFGAIALRAYGLGSRPLWVDEAESALNALTVVADGVPGDRFLGLPLYENTLVRPWPESEEYEFRDISYSDRGLAVYHSWLPLYSIAAAFRLAGVSPEDAQRSTPLRDASQGEIDHWSAVPRMPSVAFGAVFVVAAWALGWHIQGQPAALAFAFAAATSNFFVDAGRQARYYSATLAGGTICGLAIWNAWRRGRLFDHALAGLAVGVLFHIHSVSAVAMSVLYIGASPIGRGQSQRWLRVLTAGTAGAILILPWAVWSGLLSQAQSMPALLPFLDLPMVLSSLPDRPALWVTFGAGLAWFIAASRQGGGRHDFWRRPILESAPGLYFAMLWLVTSYVAFFLVMPAASYFPNRLTLMLVVPWTLALVLVIVAASRALGSTTALLPVGGTAVILFLLGELPPTMLREAQAGQPAFIEMVRRWPIGPEGRIFASPSEHLILTYYTGRPVQSIFPVRQEWLDRFAHDLIILESTRFERPTPSDIQAVAKLQGRILTPDEARSRAREAVVLATALDLQASGVAVMPAPKTPDAFDLALVAEVRRTTRQSIKSWSAGTPLGRDETISTLEDFRHAFFYWFSNPTQRKGAGLNYRACRAAAHATVLPNGVTVLDCRRDREVPLVPASLRTTEP